MASTDNRNDMAPQVRAWHKADIHTALTNVRFWGAKRTVSRGHRWRFGELSWFCHIHDACHLLAGEQKDCDQEVFSHSPGSVGTNYQGIIDVAHAFSGQESQLLAPCLPECCVG